MVITNAHIITPFRILYGSIRIRNGAIVEIVEDNLKPYSGEEHMDVGGNYLAPGFIDIHVHGGGGFDFMDNTEEAFIRITQTHAQYGTTAMLPTSLTSDTSELVRLLETYKSVLHNNLVHTRLLGIHLEGPYFAMNQRGAQDSRFIRNPDPQEYLPILENYAPYIARWSAAPELPGALEFGKAAQQAGIMVSIAHTDALYEDVVRSLESGFSLATHLYSGMSGMVRKNAYRYAGTIETCLLLDEIPVELIADGIHLPRPFLQLILKNKGTDKIVLVTDAMRASGTDATHSRLGSVWHGLDVIIEDNIAKLPDRSSFAGSVATADILIRTMVNVAGVGLADAVKMLTYNPAKLLGKESEIGSVGIGKKADIVVFDDNIQVQYTIIDGKVIYDSNKRS
ncbi:MAG: N-acetylglucosamine-6-phosphate deacetylase [Chitinophagaceae bacterium]